MRKVPTLVSLIFIVFVFSFDVAGQNGESTARNEVLNNDKVLTLVQAGLPSSIIVNKINSSKTNFNTDTDELIRLQKAKVPTEVINAMVAASTRASETSSATGAGDVTRADPNDPAAAHDAGIYLFREINGKREMTQLEPSVSKQTKTGGLFGAAITGGLTKVKFKAALAGHSATLRIDSQRPVFYFYFEVKNSGLSSNSYYATSPNDFVLIKFNEKTDTREVTVSQASVFGAQSGAMDKATRAFKVEKLSPGVFRVIPVYDLAEGEYGFYNAAGSAGPSGGAKIFDFGIKLPR